MEGLGLIVEATIEHAHDVGRNAISDFSTEQYVFFFPRQSSYPLESAISPGDDIVSMPSLGKPPHEWPKAKHRRIRRAQHLGDRAGSIFSFEEKYTRRRNLLFLPSSHQERDTYREPIEWGKQFP